MSNQAPTYSVRIAYPDLLVRGRAQIVSLPLYLDGALSAPTAGNVTLYGPSGEIVIANAVATITSSIATKTWTSSQLATTLSLGHGYRESWEILCADGVTRTYQRDAALVLHAAYPVVTDLDILAVYPDLGSQRDGSVTSFQTQIDESWKRIMGRLEQQGVFPEHVVTSWSLREVHTELCLYLICLGFVRAQGARWSELAEIHKKEFEMAWSRLTFVKGLGADGQADSDTQSAAGKGVTFVNASPRASWRGFAGIP